MSRILVAGVGNIFNGDDAFGVEVAQRLSRRALPADVDVVDFGIRGMDLTYALLDDYDTAVLVDVTQRRGAPGTLYVIEPELPEADELEPEEMMLAAHDLDPNKVLRLVNARGGRCRRLLLVGCEPATFGDEIDGAMGLSEPVEAAVDEALGVVESLLEEIRTEASESAA